MALCYDIQFTFLTKKPIFGALMKSTMSIISLLTILCGTFACHSPANLPGNKFTPGDRVITKSDQLFKDDDQPGASIYEILPEIDEIAFDQQTKRLFILGRSDELLFFDSNMVLVNNVSSHGQGPGEMTNPRILRCFNDRVYVSDNGSNKICVFNQLGHWITDVIIRDRLIESYDVDYLNRVVVPEYRPLEHSPDSIFHSYRDDGEVIQKMGAVSFVLEDLGPVDPILKIAPNRELILGFQTHGCFYRFDSSGTLLSQFSIQHGPEWKASVAFEERLEKQTKIGKSWPVRINIVNFDSHGNIWNDWYGDFKGKKTIAMIFSSKGIFIGRLFNSDAFPYPPTTWALETDSTMIIYTNMTEQFYRCTFGKYKKS